jgi:hypothetical protein
MKGIMVTPQNGREMNVCLLWLIICLVILQHFKKINALAVVLSAPLLFNFTKRNAQMLKYLFSSHLQFTSFCSKWNDPSEEMCEAQELPGIHLALSCAKLLTYFHSSTQHSGRYFEIK